LEESLAIGNRRSTITETCNNNIQRQRAWGSSPTISSTNFYIAQISRLRTISCNREQKTHNHRSMQQQYSVAKSMGKQSNNFIYKFIQSSNEGPNRRRERGSEWEPRKILLQRENSSYAPNSRPRIPTRVCQGHVVTTDLPTLGMNPKQT
jgi:hypothetical protein